MAFHCKCTLTHPARRLATFCFLLGHLSTECCFDSSFSCSSYYFRFLSLRHLLLHPCTSSHLASPRIPSHLASLFRSSLEVFLMWQSLHHLAPASASSPPVGRSWHISIRWSIHTLFVITSVHVFLSSTTHLPPQGFVVPQSVALPLRFVADLTSLM